MSDEVTSITQVQAVRSEPAVGAEILPPLSKDAHLLSGEQQTALTELARGQSFKEAARVAGVHRVTLYRWINSHAAFRAAYNAWEQEARESARSRLLAAAEDAVTFLIEEMKSNKKLAFQLIKELGIFRPRRGGNLDKVDLVRRDIELRDVEAHRRLDRRFARAAAQSARPGNALPSIETLRRLVRERLAEEDDLEEDDDFDDEFDDDDLDDTGEARRAS